MIHHLLAKGLATLVIGGGAYKAWKWYQSGKNVAPVPPGPSPTPSPIPAQPAPTPSPVDPGTITGPQPGDTNGLVTSAGSSDVSSGTGITTDAGGDAVVTNDPSADPSNPTGDTSSSGASDGELIAIASDASGALGVLGAFGL